MSDSSKTTGAGSDNPSIVFADRVTRIAPSPTVAISSLALDLRAAGRDVIGLAVGEQWAQYHPRSPAQASRQTRRERATVLYP